MQSEPGLWAGHRTIARKLGHLHDQAAALEDGPELPRRACIGSESPTEAEAVVIGGLGRIDRAGAGEPGPGQPTIEIPRAQTATSTAPTAPANTSTTPSDHIGP